MTAKVDTPTAPVLEARGLSVTYGRGPGAVRALGDVSFSVAPGEFVCVVGPSGCGKTTLLKSLSGLLVPTSGQTLVEGRPVTGVPEGLAMVFQEYTRSLLPWRSVKGNVTFPLQAKGLAREEIETRASEALAEVGLAGFEDKYPWQLSGGMQQRVAIARALAFRPAVLLMDEPFASVDAQVRADLEDLMLTVQRDTGVTVLFVTHDIDESVYLGDRVVVLSHRPTRVRESIDVTLPKPREQLATKALPEFVELRTRVLALIQQERHKTGASDGS
jgi:NitT/TauT family transport system ATP-binding protein